MWLEASEPRFELQTNKQMDVTKCLIACQGGWVSSKTRRHGADKTLALNPLVSLNESID